MWAKSSNKTAKELYGIDNFTDMIADETDLHRLRRPDELPAGKESSGTVQWSR